MSDLRFVLIKGPLETLNVMVDWIERELYKRGIPFFELDIRYIDRVDMNELELFVSASNVCALTFNNIGAGLCDVHGNYWADRKIPLVSWIVDHPRNYDDFLVDPSCDIYVFVLDDNHKSFIEKYYPSVKATYIMHYGARYADDLPERYTDRDIDVVYMGTNGQAVEVFPRLELFEDGGRDFFQTTIRMMLNDPDYVKEEAIKQYFTNKGEDISEEELFDLFLNASGFIENYVRREIRFRGIAELDKQGISVDIYGGIKSWTSDSYHYSDRIHIYERIDPSLVPDIMKRAKITLSYTPWFKLGCSEKPIDAMVGGSLCVSDHNSYLDANYTDGEDIILFDLADQQRMASRVRYLLDHTDEAERIARQGHIKSMGREQWSHRMDKMISIAEDILKQRSMPDDDCETVISHESDGEKITIVVPCHNCADTVQTTWGSVLDQTVGIEHIECIFVDDASDDGGKTWQALQAIEHTCPDSVMIIHLDENMRQGGARNVGISYASGGYLMFLDSDDELMPNACEVAFNEAERSNADVVMYNHRRTLGDKARDYQSISERKTYHITGRGDRIQFLNSTIVDYGCWNKLYRMSLIRRAEAKFAEHAVYEEPLFVYPCFLYADTVLLITDVLYIYNLHDESTVSSAIGPRLLDHPRVQLELLEYCMNHTDIYNEYRDVIGLYFLWSYYCETMCFAVDNHTVIPLEYFMGMQTVCQRFFADWRNNPQIKALSGNITKVLESIDRTFGSQEELDEYIYKAAELL